MNHLAPLSTSPNWAPAFAGVVRWTESLLAHQQALALTRAWRATNATFVKGSRRRDQKGSRCADMTARPVLYPQL